LRRSGDDIGKEDVLELTDAVLVRWSEKLRLKLLTRFAVNRV